jgi:hypothetical protein
MLRKGAATHTRRRERSRQRTRYIAHNTTVLGALRAVLIDELRPATVFQSRRIFNLLLAHILIAALLCAVYYHVKITSGTESQEFLPGIKDFADLCVTGVVFLLGGFVTTMLTRWYATTI